MKKINLFPHSYKKIGWFIFIPSLILGILALCFNWSFTEVTIPFIYNSGYLAGGVETGFFSNVNVDFFLNLIGILVIVGGMLVGFSKEKIEDEYIITLRLRSLFWSFVVSYTILLLLYISIFGSLFFIALLIAIYMPLILYVFRFNYLLLKNEE